AALAGVHGPVECGHLPPGLRPPGFTPPPEPPSHAREGTPSPLRPPFRAIGEELRELERRRMAEALEATGGVQTRAAALIGMPLRTFVLKLKQYGLGTPRVGAERTG